MNLNYPSRKEKNVPEGGLEGSRVGTATMGALGTGPEGEAVSSLVPEGRVTF